MRKQLCNALVRKAADPRMVFLTGDLGFMALEPLQAALGERFINAGVAEQNMVSVAAALSRQNLDVWIYSIAPFCFARPFEQIRNDIVLHGLPVKIIGNGGGYGYGVMGPTHHALEDYGVLSTLDSIISFVPAFDEDVDEVVNRIGSSALPGYLRLGKGEAPAGWPVPSYAPWRRLTDGEGCVVVTVGPLTGIYVDHCLKLPVAVRPRLWCVSELPLNAGSIPAELLHDIGRANVVHVVEEHVRAGSLAADLGLHLLEMRLAPAKFISHTARVLPGCYGSQKYLRTQAGLDPTTVLAEHNNPGAHVAYN